MTTSPMKVLCIGKLTKLSPITTNVQAHKALIVIASKLNLSKAATLTLIDSSNKCLLYNNNTSNKCISSSSKCSSRCNTKSKSMWNPKITWDQLNQRARLVMMNWVTTAQACNQTLTNQMEDTKTKTSVCKCKVTDKKQTITMPTKSSQVWQLPVILSSSSHNLKLIRSDNSKKVLHSRNRCKLLRKIIFKCRKVCKELHHRNI